MLQELQALQAVLKEQLEQAKNTYKRFADHHRQPGPPLKVGDRVWLSTKFLRSQWPSHKLEARNAGPFRITQQINPVAFRLQLPASFRIHPVFHRSLLTPALPPHPLSSKPLPPPPIQVNGEEEFEVAQILDSRRHRGRLQYLIDWQGYSPEERSWEDATQVHAPRLVQRFHQRYPDKPGPGGRRRVGRGAGDSVMAPSEDSSDEDDSGVTAADPGAAGDTEEPPENPAPSAPQLQSTPGTAEALQPDTDSEQDTPPSPAECRQQKVRQKRGRPVSLRPKR
ncbi:chromo domain-containing protein cec-1-like [Rhineura floridana]|uniref:chromo domain-containing protein cec-1-like n=1 Tax=Rhineura floridana TaxID=261503 RepID=UPI002AC877DA|nr:chromo domain-containing protein cec-1-like [Rhineura floridana]